MAREQATSTAKRRGTVALANTVGGATVQLRMPVPPVAGDSGEELGLRAPEFQTQVLNPVVVRQSGSKTTALVPAKTLEDLLGIEGTAAVRIAMQSVSEVLVDDASFVLVDVQVAARAGNKALLYRFLLEGQGIEVI